MPKINVAAIQCSLGADPLSNREKITAFIEQAAAAGAQIILPSELFLGPYFCKVEDDAFFASAQDLKNSPDLKHFQKLAQALKIVLPISLFEKDGPHYYNSVVMFDADGTELGIYRKSHIPDGPGYEEKFYFRPGNTGFKVWKTRYGKVGVGICWDQWFPEAARAMCLQGADLLLYPTAIGSEPQDANLNTKDPWQRAMIGHAVSNAVPVIAANRIGQEEQQSFYGHSFIADVRGDKIAEFNEKQEGLLQAEFDWEANAIYRAAFGFFRDRRPELYQELCKP